MATNNIGVGSNQTVDGLPGNDSIFGTGAPSLNDIIYGHMGNDSINGGSGGTEIDLSTMYGGQGNDSITANNFDRVYGNLGNDSLYGTGSNSTFYGGQGNDTVLANGSGNSNVVYGNLGDDSIGDGASTFTNSSIYGGQGNDTISVHGDGNVIHGNLGDDSIISGTANSTVYGDGGNDAIAQYLPGTNSVLYGNLGDDTLYGASTSTLYGGQGNDVVLQFSGGTNDLLYGNLGNDLLVDRSTVAGANSTMYGGQGNDTLVSITANGDIMNGGLNSDLFVDSYGTASATGGHTTTVSDFVTGTDQVSFGSGAGISINTPAPSGNNTNFVGSQNNTITNEADAAKYAATLDTGANANLNAHYLFVAGANDGYLFYDGAGGSGMFNGEITLTGHNSLTSLSANDITGSTADQTGATASDVRVKRDITVLERLANGLNLYRYRYTWSDEVYVGVMAHEVATVRPDAVVRGQDGLLRVFYDRLGLTLQTWSQWTAARGQEVGTPA